MSAKEKVSRRKQWNSFPYISTGVYLSRWHEFESISTTDQMEFEDDFFLSILSRGVLNDEDEDYDIAPLRLRRW